MGRSAAQSCPLMVLLGPTVLTFRLQSRSTASTTIPWGCSTLNRRNVLRLSGGAVVAGLTASRWNQAHAQAGVVPRRLIVHRPQPLNAEPPLARLRAAFITLQPDFYVRSHGTIPKLTGTCQRLWVLGHSR